jgi:hypothetical protein
MADRGVSTPGSRSRSIELTPDEYQGKVSSYRCSPQLRQRARHLRAAYAGGRPDCHIQNHTAVEVRPALLSFSLAADATWSPGMSDVGGKAGLLESMR